MNKILRKQYTEMGVLAWHGVWFHPLHPFTNQWFLGIIPACLSFQSRTALKITRCHTPVILHEPRPLAIILKWVATSMRPQTFQLGSAWASQLRGSHSQTSGEPGCLQLFSTCNAVMKHQWWKQYWMDAYTACVSIFILGTNLCSGWKKVNHHSDERGRGRDFE